MITQDSTSLDDQSLEVPINPIGALEYLSQSVITKRAFTKTIMRANSSMGSNDEKT